MPGQCRKVLRTKPTPGFSSEISGGGSPVFEPPGAPKHFPFPVTPMDDELFYEVLMGVFTFVASSLQHLHLYRTLWWLPHAHTNQTMNFYLIDFHLVVFIGVILSRRLVYVVGCRILRRLNWESGYCLEYFRFGLFALICFSLGVCCYFVMQNHPLVNILYLCYPVMIYLLLFGCNIHPFFELINDKTYLALHACSVNSKEIRKEVDCLKGNFNCRMKQILFSGIVNAYYAGFIPCCFAQTVLHYDLYWASQHVIFIFLSCFFSLATQILSLRYCDILHRAALHLGSWDKLENRNILLVNSHWKEDVVFPFGAMVKYNRDIFRGQAECNAAEPGNNSSAKFYFMFKDPSLFVGLLLSVHASMVLFQLIILVRATLWHNILSITFLLFFNYYLLYKLSRDYLISHRVYKEERLMHDKTSSRVS